MATGRLFSSIYGVIDVESSTGLAIQSLAGAVSHVGTLSGASLTSSQNATTGASAPSASYVQADEATISTLANALKVSYNALQVDVAAQHTDIATLKTAVNAILASLEAAGFVTP